MDPGTQNAPRHFHRAGGGGQVADRYPKYEKPGIGSVTSGFNDERNFFRSSLKFSAQGNQMEEYLTTDELSQRIKMAPGSIRNLVWKKKLKENIHYVKPSAKKLLFVWSAIEAWLYGGMKPEESVPERQTPSGSLINI